MGAVENKLALVWMYPEVEWTNEWKKEYARLYKESEDA